MRITISDSHMTITDFYRSVAEAIGYTDTSVLNFDCREINIAANIQDNIIAFYRENAKDVTENDFKTGMCMLLACYGAKVDAALANDEVEVFDGFIVKETEK